MKTLLKGSIDGYIERYASWGQVLLFAHWYGLLNNAMRLTFLRFDPNRSMGFKAVCAVNISHFVLTIELFLTEKGTKETYEDILTVTQLFR